MTPAELEACFVAAQPKALDFHETEYLANKTKFDEIATKTGYFFAGFRLGRAVFSTKQKT